MYKDVKNQCDNIDALRAFIVCGLIPNGFGEAAPKWDTWNVSRPSIFSNKKGSRNVTGGGGAGNFFFLREITKFVYEIYFS